MIKTLSLMQTRIFLCFFALMGTIQSMPDSKAKACRRILKAAKDMTVLLPLERVVIGDRAGIEVPLGGRKGNIPALKSGDYLVGIVDRKYGLRWELRNPNTNQTPVSISETYFNGHLTLFNGLAKELEEKGKGEKPNIIFAFEGPVFGNSFYMANRSGKFRPGMMGADIAVKLLQIKGFGPEGANANTSIISVTGNSVDMAAFSEVNDRLHVRASADVYYRLLAQEDSLRAPGEPTLGLTEKIYALEALWLRLAEYHVRPGLIMNLEAAREAAMAKMGKTYLTTITQENYDDHIQFPNKRRSQALLNHPDYLPPLERRIVSREEQDRLLSESDGKYQLYDDMLRYIGNGEPLGWIAYRWATSPATAGRDLKAFLTEMEQELFTELYPPR